MAPRRLTVADVSVIHPGADTYVRAAAATAGSATKLRDDQKHAKYNRSGSDVYMLESLSHESYGRLGQPASRLLNELGNLGSSTGAVDTSFIDSALQELSVSLRRSSHRIVAAYAALQTRMTGSALIPGPPAPSRRALLHRKPGCAGVARVVVYSVRDFPSEAGVVHIPCGSRRFSEIVLKSV